MKYTRVGNPGYPGTTSFSTKRNDTRARNAQFVARMEGLVQRWEAEVERLALKIDGVAPEAKEACVALVASLRLEGAAARVSLEQIRRATTASSRGLQAGSQRTWNEMTASLARLTTAVA